MRFKTLLTLAAFALLFCTTPARTQTGAPAPKTQTASPDAPAPELQQDQKVIDDFVVTRGVSFEDTSKKSQPPKPASGQTGGAGKTATGASSKKGSSPTQTASRKRPTKLTTSGKGKGTTTTGEGTSDTGEARPDVLDGAKTVKASGAALRPIGLGYTIYMKESAGDLLPVEPSREYKSGDRIAIALEPNTDGYIYIFNAENDQDPLMLFPNVQLDAGANEAHAHVRETYPSNVNYAFEFDRTTAIEHIYVVISRRPLEGVLTGEALAEFCGKNREDCYWKPSPAEWARIKSGAAGGRVIEAKNGTLLAQAGRQSVPPSSLQRGIKIKKDEPAPAVVRVNDSPQTDTLVTVIKLVHK